MASTSQGSKFFDLHIDVNDLTDQFRDMNASLKTAVVNTLNQIGRASNKEIAADIKENYNIKARSLKIGKLVRLHRADQRKEVPTFTISILKKGRGLALYSAKRGQAGVSVKVKRGRKVVKGSYFVRTKIGRTFVARKAKERRFIVRTSKTGRRYVARASEFLFGPSIAALYARRKSFALIRKVVKRDYQQILDTQFNNQFEKKRR
jgi:hypothetical protein